MKLNHKLYSKSVLGAGIFIAASLFPSCKKDFLDVPQQGQQQGEAFWRTAADAGAGVNAIYGNMRSYENTAFPAIAIESMGSDDAEKGSSPSDASFFLDFDTFTIDPNQGNISGFWNGQYRNINYCNRYLPMFLLLQWMKR